MIEHGALDDLIARLAALPAAERSRVPGIKPARADIVLAGALVIQGVMRAGGFATLEVTGAGLREGILFERQLVRQQLDAVAQPHPERAPPDRGRSPGCLDGHAGELGDEHGP